VWIWGEMTLLDSVVHLELSSGSPQWNVSFIGTAHDWEVNVFASFFNLLYSYGVRQEGKEKLLWVP